VATNSTVVGGTGLATVQFSSSADLVSLSGTFGAGSLAGGDGADTLVFLSGAAISTATSVLGGSGADSILFNGNTLSGIFAGGADADLFSGSVTIGTSGVSFWGGLGNDIFNFSSFTGAGAGSTAYFWNDQAGFDSIVFGSVVSGGSGSSGNAAGVAFGITAASGFAISFTDAQTSASFGTGISNLFQVGTSNLVTFGINSLNYISLLFGNASSITLQGFDSAEAKAITNTFGTAGNNSGTFGTIASIPTFS
jgi:hypothetical protein